MNFAKSGKIRTARYRKKLSELGKIASTKRWENERKRRDPSKLLYEIEKAKVLNESTDRKGSYIGTLEWRDHSGKVRRWVIRRGTRFNQMTIDGVRGAKCVTSLMEKLRKSLSRYFRGASIGS